MSKLEKIVVYLSRLVKEKFSGGILITFSQGGIRGIKKVNEENVELF
jgi:hypothetical protein